VQQVGYELKPLGCDEFDGVKLSKQQKGYIYEAFGGFPPQVLQNRVWCEEANSAKNCATRMM